MNRLRFTASLFLSLLVYIFFLIPPLLVNFDSTKVLFTDISFPLQSLVNSLLFLFLYMFRKKLFFLLEYQEDKNCQEYQEFSSEANTSPESRLKASYIIKSRKKSNHFTKAFSFLMTLGLLLLLSALLQFLADKVKLPSLSESIKPEGKEWLFIILSFISQGFSEEFLYRFFLPESIYSVFKYFKKEKIFSKNRPAGLLLFLLFEFIFALIFSFSHRYLGFFAVINAFLAHFILRFSYLKCDNIAITSSVHIIYNLFQLIFFI